MKKRVSPSFMVIGQSQPGAGKGTLLTTVNSELELVQKLVHPNLQFTTLVGDETTQAGALETLQCNTWVHLSVLDIVENGAPQAEFIFLSVCHTTVGNEETGFKSVIGTLWAVDDAIEKHAVEEFYGRMFKDYEGGCHRLHEGGLGTY